MERLGEFTLLLVRQLTIKSSDPASVWLIMSRCHVWQVLFSVNWVITLLLRPLQVLIRLFIHSWLEITCRLNNSPWQMLIEIGIEIADGGLSVPECPSLVSLFLLPSSPPVNFSFVRRQSWGCSDWESTESQRAPPGYCRASRASNLHQQQQSPHCRHDLQLPTDYWEIEKS